MKQNREYHIIESDNYILDPETISIIVQSTQVDAGIRSHTFTYRLLEPLHTTIHEENALYVRFNGNELLRARFF